MIALGALIGTSAAAAAPSTLFSITATNAAVTGTKGNMRVSIPASSSMSWFTDRPGRTAGTATASALVAAWPIQHFDTDPPNAALVTTRKGKTMQTIVVLSDPRTKGRRVSFRYRVLSDETMLEMETTGRPTLGTYARASLFVDDAPMVFCPATFNASTPIGTTPATGYKCLMTANTTYQVSGHSPWLNVQGCHPASSTGGGYVHWVDSLWDNFDYYSAYDYNDVGPLPVCKSDFSAFAQIADEYAATNCPDCDPRYYSESLTFSSTDALTLLSTYRVN
ncbi:MAG: hypothetical protein NTX95_02850 [Actinobacteria bacterium]|nr:hypothetical protein [Actinomycetota bacterium]